MKHKKRTTLCPKNAPGLTAVTWPKLNQSSKFFHC